MLLSERAALLRQLDSCIIIQDYGRDTSAKKTRFRIEFRTDNPIVERQALETQVPCVCCGNLIHPFRKRRPPRTGIYVAVTCPQGISNRCSRTPLAANEYNAIRAAVEKQRRRKAAK